MCVVYGEVGENLTSRMVKKLSHTYTLLCPQSYPFFIETIQGAVHVLLHNMWIQKEVRVAPPPDSAID